MSECNTLKVNKILYILCAFFLGIFGAHKFILGKVAVGFAYLVAGFFTFFIISAVLILVDIIKVAALPMDSHGNVQVKAQGFFEK